MHPLLATVTFGALGLGALGGCLSAPTGLDPGAIDAPIITPWPPPSANIIAIATGDVDGDGKEDLVAVDGGNARVFLLRGGADIDPMRATVTTSSRSAPLPGLRPPVAVTVAAVTGMRFILVFDTPIAGPRLTVFDAQLAQNGQTSVGVPPAAPGGIVTLTQSTFGIGMNAVFGSVPNAVFFVEGPAVDDPVPAVLVLPQIGATPFASVLATSGYVTMGAPGTPRVFVSEPARTQRADSGGPGQFTWTPARTGGDWTAQVIAEVSGDTYPDVVGFSPEGASPARICASDVNAAGAPPCFNTAFGMDTATLAAGSVVQPGQTDLVLLHVPPVPPGMASLFLVPDLRIMGGNVVADGFSPPGNFSVDGPLVAVAQLDSAGEEILLVGRDGEIICLRSTGGAPVRCTP